jgi:hypothetical protein
MESRGDEWGSPAASGGRQAFASMLLGVADVLLSLCVLLSRLVFTGGCRGCGLTGRRALPNLASVSRDHVVARRPGHAGRGLTADAMPAAPSDAEPLVPRPRGRCCSAFSGEADRAPFVSAMPRIPR